MTEKIYGNLNHLEEHCSLSLLHFPEISVMKKKNIIL